VRGRAEPIYPVRSARPDGRVIFDGSGKRRIAALPARTICSGHVFHVQQAVETQGCIVMHLTFVEAGVAGKFWRLREAGLYPRVPEAVGAHSRLLSFTPPQIPGGVVPPVVPMPPKAADGQGWSVEAALRGVPRLQAHVRLVDRHLTALRNALAVAKALGRELILPRLLCLCERAQQPGGVLPSCVKDGASTPLPFVCPVEHILDVEELQELWTSGYLILRPWTLLNRSYHQRAADALAGGVVTVRWLRGGTEGTPATTPASSMAASSPTPTEVWLRPGLSDAEWRVETARVSAARSARVLHLESAEEAIFGGFEDEAAAELFDRKMRSHFVPGTRRFSASWCCTHTHYQAGTILYKRPYKLPRGASAKGGATAAVAAQLHETSPRPCYWEDCRNLKRPRMPDDI
jgi:hypothetical protein